ncbi:MAG TPA: SpoIID/LytB domain-containing protein [Solirubrobacteraceae bacterium]|nr:SpoIID/LytB domain-containing protein [Solirubrobacteraceae bacterium]
MRKLAVIASLAASLALAPAASAASSFSINGGGDGHGIGLSQYGAYGYALHGKDYRFILAHYYQGTSLGTTNPNQTVRVLISTGSAAFSGATAAGSQKLKATHTYSVRAMADGTLRLYDQNGKKVGAFQSPLRVTGPAPLQLAGRGPYRGALEFRTVPGGVQTVDALALDDYVRGVVAAEMPSGWSPEALKAQAVAARTYAITTNVGGNGYGLYSDTRSQEYGGVAAETPSTDAAVAATRGQIVTYNGVPATTFFFSSSGGYTEDIQNVWLGSTPEPWLRGVSDPYDGAGGNPYHHWSYQLNLASAAHDLGSLVKGSLVGIQVTSRGVSPRVIGAQVVGTGGRTNVTGPQLQSIFGLPSTYMTFSTISATPGAPSTSGGQAPKRTWLEKVRAAIVALARPPRGLHGSVFPARKGAPITIQRSTARGWRTAAHARLAAGGRYSVRLRRAGSYRIVYHGVPGPRINVG